VSFLIVAGTDLDGNNQTLGCIERTWGEDPPDTSGEVVEMQDGSLGSTERTPRRKFSGDVFFASKALFDTFRDAISVSGAPGVPVVIVASSDADGLLAGGSLSVLARLGRCTGWRQGAAGAPSTANWRASLTLVAVQPS
jgi:hypothetical protein